MKRHNNKQRKIISQLFTFRSLSLLRAVLFALIAAANIIIMMLLGGGMPFLCRCGGRPSSSYYGAEAFITSRIIPSPKPKIRSLSSFSSSVVTTSRTATAAIAANRYLDGGVRCYRHYYYYENQASGFFFYRRRSTALFSTGATSTTNNSAASSDDQKKDDSDNSRRNKQNSNKKKMKKPQRPQQKPVPMTLLSGFLGTGKTSTLQHLLENKDELKIGVIVNDVASINIDAKLIANHIDSSSGGDNMIELQNGCACCSLSDELFFSVEKLVMGRKLDAIVVELSGVADPAAIENTWQNAPDVIREIANLSNTVTLVDATTFGSDYLTWDVAKERKGWVDPGDDCSGNRKVSELLAEQVEAADLILVNKIDLATKEQVDVATAVARALNEKAKLEQVQYGRISPRQVLGEAVVVETTPNDESENKEPKLDDDHDGGVVACDEPDCTDTSHSHAHHEHHDDEGVAAACMDPDCTDTSSHDHACTDPDCTEDHEHSHDHSSTRSSTSTDALGIVNFVYKSNRPFNAVRLMQVLNQWPVPIEETLDLGILQDARQNAYEVGGRVLQEDSPFIGVLRSKGFCWFAPHKWSGANADAFRHDTAMYWSHAGRQFGISAAGRWWATLPDSKMKKYFVDNLSEYERIKREDFQTEEFGDRRQEIVFIGTELKEDEITATLNSCLLTDRELDAYRQKLQNYMDAVLSSPGPSQGLFDVGGVDHTDL